jgi:large subunit ribosomal protein L30
MTKLIITQRKSIIGAPRRQRLSMEALGIRRMHQTVQHDDSPQIRGMIEKVRHLVEVEESK